MESDEEALGDWMMDFEKDERVRCRIACYERGYSESEALYPNISSWELANNKNWYEYISEII
jgi:hypothetical protein